jgi:uncharacterized protein YbjT (DUF2867 family)
MTVLMATDARDVLVTGGTGYIGQRLVSHLAARGHRVRVLARRTARARVPAMATAVEGDALDAASVASALRPGDTIVHLVGTPHPNPRKAAEFERVDLASIRATTAAARQVAPAHIVYVSVAHPAPMMHAYIAVRTAGEEAVSAVGCSATIVRPWYVLGPGHWWPVVLIPVYAIARMIPKTRDGATRLGLVTVTDMVWTLVAAVEHPPTSGAQILSVPDIKEWGRRGSLEVSSP